MKDFKVCKTCTTPSACKASMKCGDMVKKGKSGYSKGGMVSCGASNPPAQKRSK